MMGKRSRIDNLAESFTTVNPAAVNSAAMNHAAVNHAEPTEQREAVRALEHLRGLLPSYRDFCGAAPYYYAAGEVRRLEHQLIQVYSADELAHVSKIIQLQLVGMVHAIRQAKGRGVELDG